MERPQPNLLVKGPSLYGGSMVATLLVPECDLAEIYARYMGDFSVQKFIDFLSNNGGAQLHSAATPDGEIYFPSEMAFTEGGALKEIRYNEFGLIHNPSGLADICLGSAESAEGRYFFYGEFVLSANDLQQLRESQELPAAIAEAYQERFSPVPELNFEALGDCPHLQPVDTGEILGAVITRRLTRTFEHMPVTR